MSKFVNPYARIAELETALERIVQWNPEPDWKKAAELLKTGGITLDAVSANCMRHVVERVGEIARYALQDKDAHHE